MNVKLHTPLFAVALATALVGCASNSEVVHTTEFRDVILSPQKRSNPDEGLTLVSLSHSGRVTIRDTRGNRWHAKEGEIFTSDQGTGCGYTLKSLNRQNRECGNPKRDAGILFRRHARHVLTLI